MQISTLKFQLVYFLPITNNCHGICDLLMQIEFKLNSDAVLFASGGCVCAAYFLNESVNRLKKMTPIK